jgi:MoaA/NifB/PqqE/SkfB family radical SAM enzyme
LLEAREILLRRRFKAVIDDLAKARDRLAADQGGDETAAVAWCGEAVARASGETAEIAKEFRGIRLELATNGLLTPELETRLVSQIAEPLAMIVEQELAATARACRGDQAGRRPAVVLLVDAALARLRAVLERMLELESVNEVIERLRGVIRLQEEIRSDTLDRQRKRGREALESP